MLPQLSTAAAMPMPPGWATMVAPPGAVPNMAATTMTAPPLVGPPMAAPCMAAAHTMAAPPGAMAAPHMAAAPTMAAPPGAAPHIAASTMTATHLADPHMAAPHMALAHTMAAQPVAGPHMANAFVPAPTAESFAVVPYVEHTSVIAELAVACRSCSDSFFEASSWYKH